MPPSRHRLWVTLPLLPAPPRRPAPHLCPPAHVPAAPGREPSFLLVSEVACPCVADPSGSRRQSEPNSPRLQGDTDAQRRRLGSAQGRSGNVRCTGPSWGHSHRCGTGRRGRVTWQSSSSLSPYPVLCDRDPDAHNLAAP